MPVPLASHLAQHVANVIDGDGALAVELRAELRQGVLGPSDRRFFAGNANFAVAMRDRDPERLADGSQMLVACTEQRKGSVESTSGIVASVMFSGGTLLAAASTRNSNLSQL